MTKGKTYIYCRVSSDSQKENGTSIDRQVEMGLAYCALHSLSEPVIIKDEALSGYYDSNRAGFQTILKLCKSGEASTIIVYDLSRLSRNLKTTLEFIDLVSKKDIAFISLTEKIDTSSAYGKFITHIFASIHQLYRDSISEKMQLYCKHKRSKGEKVGYHLEYGFDLAANGKTLVPNIEEQAVIQNVIELRNKGLSLKQISTKLNSGNVKTKQNKRFYPISIKRILDKHPQKHNLVV